MSKYKFYFLIILLLFPVVSWIIVFTCMFLGREFISDIYIFIATVLALSLLICFTLFMLALRKLSSEIMLSREVKLLEQHARIDRLQNKELESLNREAEEKYISFIQSLLELKTLIENQKYEAARSRIRDLNFSTAKKGDNVYCSDFFINTILQIKMEEAKEHGIRTEYRIVLPPLKDNSRLNYLELSSLFFNLLDNGIESCISSGNHTPFLSLEITCHKKILRIHMENTKDSMIQFDGSTTKDEKESHGFGLKIIEEIVHEHQGVCQWTDKGDIFDSVLLINYTK